MTAWEAARSAITARHGGPPQRCLPPWEVRVAPRAVVKLRHRAIVERLEAHGLRHRTVSVQTEGEYLPTEATEATAGATDT